MRAMLSPDGSRPDPSQYPPLFVPAIPANPNAPYNGDPRFMPVRPSLAVGGERLSMQNLLAAIMATTNVMNAGQADEFKYILNDIMEIYKTRPADGDLPGDGRPAAPMTIEAQYRNQSFHEPQIIPMIILAIVLDPSNIFLEILIHKFRALGYNHTTVTAASIVALNLMDEYSEIAVHGTGVIEQETHMTMRLQRVLAARGLETLSNDGPATRLWQSEFNQQMEGVRVMLRDHSQFRGVDIRRIRFTPLMVAAMVGNAGAVEMLLDYEESPVDPGERLEPVRQTAKGYLLDVAQFVDVPDYDEIYARLYNAETRLQRLRYAVTGGQPPVPP